MILTLVRSEKTFGLFIAEIGDLFRLVVSPAALFVEITKVKELLIDPESRAKFDRQRSARLQKAEKFKQLDEQHQRMRTGAFGVFEFISLFRSYFVW